VNGSDVPLSITLSQREGVNEFVIAELEDLKFLQYHLNRILSGMADASNSGVGSS